MANQRNSLTGTVTIPKSVTTSDYNSLLNLPRINGKTIKGNLTLEDLGIENISEEDVKHIVSEAIKNVPSGGDESSVYTIELNPDTGLYELKDGSGNVTSTFKIPRKISELEQDKNYVTSEEVNDIINNNITSADDAEINEMLDEVMPVEQTAE